MPFSFGRTYANIYHLFHVEVHEQTRSDIKKSPAKNSHLFCVQICLERESEFATVKVLIVGVCKISTNNLSEFKIGALKIIRKVNFDATFTLLILGKPIKFRSSTTDTYFTVDIVCNLLY